MGGNGIAVSFAGIPTNLHHVWDTAIPEKLVGGYSLTFASEWAGNLSLAIQDGAYRELAQGWLEGMDVDDAVGTALQWAEESNRIVCETVLPAGVEGIKGQELSGSYYEGSVSMMR